jgi:Flp pilus assembly protein CpaB
MGTLVKEPEKLFVMKTVRKGDEPKNALKAFEDVKDHRLNKQLSADYHVTPDDLLDKTAGMDLPKGMRGVAIKTTMDTAVSGFVLPHSHVDIIANLREKSGKMVSKTLWQNVLVLAVDQQQQRPDDKAAFVGATVTVEVTPVQAEELDTVVSNGGTLRLTLRGFQDEDKVTTQGASAEALIGKGATRPEDVIPPEEKETTSTTRAKAPVWIPIIPDVPATPAPTVTATAPPVPAAAPVVKEEPKKESFTLTIYNGDSASKHIFTEGAPPTVEKSQPDAPRKPSGK